MTPELTPKSPETAAADANARMVAEIRTLLAAFDWECDDRQLALEAIERIVSDLRFRRLPLDDVTAPPAVCPDQSLGPQLGKGFADGVDRDPVLLRQRFL